MREVRSVGVVGVANKAVAELGRLATYFRGRHENHVNADHNSRSLSLTGTSGKTDDWYFF